MCTYMYIHNVYVYERSINSGSSSCSITKWKINNTETSIACTQSLKPNIYMYIYLYIHVHCLGLNSILHSSATRDPVAQW